MQGLRAVLLVGSGGFIGSVLRYLVGECTARQWPWIAFPLGTLAVNTLGSFAIGVLAGLFDLRQAFGADTRLFLMVGVLGGFTTYSSYALDTLVLMRDTGLARGLANIALHTVFGLAAAWVGYQLVRQ